MTAIQAVVVNHNTSMYTELMLRTLLVKHPDLDFAVTVMDNASTDDRTGLQQYAAEKNIPIVQSGYPAADTRLNSHGEILGQFVLNHPDCDYYLFLDCDVAFIAPNTINQLQAVLDSDPTLFGVGPRQSWDTVVEIPDEYHTLIYSLRLHPCCALIKNTGLFRQIVEIIGLTGVRYCWSKQNGEFLDECKEYLDTFELMTRVMKTHNLSHRIVPPMVLHFFNVSYEERWMEGKNERCRKMLAEYREMP